MSKYVIAPFLSIYIHIYNRTGMKRLNEKVFRLCVFKSLSIILNSKPNGNTCTCNLPYKFSDDRAPSVRLSKMDSIAYRLGIRLQLRLRLRLGLEKWIPLPMNIETTCFSLSLLPVRKLGIRESSARSSNTPFSSATLIALLATPRISPFKLTDCDNGFLFPSSTS